MVPTFTSLRYTLRLARPVIALAVAALAGALAGCGGEVSDALPTEAVGPKAAAVVRVSTTGLDSASIRATMESIAKQMSKSKVPQIVQGSGLLTLRAASMDPSANPSMKALDDQMTAMRDAGILGFVAVLESISQVGDMTAVGDIAGADGVVALVQTDGRPSASEISEIVSRNASESLAAHSLGGGWFRILPEANSRPIEVAGASEAAAMELDAALKGLAATTVNFGLRMTPEVRAAFTESTEDAGMMGSFVSGFEEPMDKLNSGSASLTLGADPAIRGAMSFATAAAAGEFNDQWNQTLDAMAGMAGMFLAAPNKEGKPSVDPGLFPKMADALRFTQQEAKLTLTIDKAGWVKLLP